MFGRYVLVTFLSFFYVWFGLVVVGVAAAPKHFICNNQETNRANLNVSVSTRALHEIYFPAFKAVIVEAKTCCIMTSSHRVNNLPCSSSEQLISNTLKNTWDFEGVVISGWHGVRDDPVGACKAGLSH